jgi:hypothetical protein
MDRRKRSARPATPPRPNPRPTRRPPTWEVRVAEHGDARARQLAEQPAVEQLPGQARDLPLRLHAVGKGRSQLVDAQQQRRAVRAAGRGAAIGLFVGVSGG